MSTAFGTSVRWRERATAASVLLLAGMLCWQSAGVLLRDRDRERARSGVDGNWLEASTDVEALSELARRRESGGDAAAVVALARRVIRRHPLDAETRLRLALALAAQGEHEGARLHVAQAARIARNHPELLLYCGQARLRAWATERDLEALREAAGHFRDALRRDHRLLARVREMLGTGDDGLGAAANLVALVPDTPAAWREAARVFTANGDWEAAATAHRRAGSDGAERAVEAMARAHAEARAGNPTLALAAAGQAVEVARGTERERVIRSAVRLLRGLPESFRSRGEALCAAWTTRWPELPVTQIELVDWALHRGDVSRALEWLAALPPPVREEPEVLDLRGQAAAQANRPDVAERYYRRALQGERGQPHRWLRLVHWIEGRDRVDEALALADQARRRHPGHAGIEQTRDRLVGKSVGVPPK